MGRMKMDFLRRVACVSLALILSAGHSCAVLPEEMLQELQDHAPEQLTIQVLAVTTRVINSDQRLDVHVRAKVMEVKYSASGLKRGQIISIRYETYVPIPDYIFDALSFGVLKKDRTYPAFLGPWKQAEWIAKRLPGTWLEPAAHDASFSPPIAKE